MYGMPSKSTTLPREESLGYQVNHLARLLAAALRERIEPHGVVPGQFAQMLALLERDGVSQSELSQQADQRRAVIHLTPRAWELAPTLVGAAREVNALAATGVSPADLDTCMRVLAAAIDNLQGSP